MDYDVFYKKINLILADTTPLPADCGQVCGKNCCKGDSETGMLLFPHEKTPFRTVGRNGRRLAVCAGSCDRNERPLSCRLFPFFPVPEESGIRVVPDHRGRGVCPLIDHFDEVIFDETFLAAVRQAGELLAKDPEILAFMRETAEEIAFEKRLTEMFMK